MLTLVLWFILVLSVFANAYAQEEYTMKQLAANDSMQVELQWPDIKVDEIRDFSVRFVDPSSNELLNNVAFDLRIMQGENLIEDYHDEVANGVMILDVLFEETGPATIHVSVKSVDNKTVSESVIFSVNVIPEFPIIILVMAVSMAIVIAIRFSIIAKARFH